MPAEKIGYRMIGMDLIRRGSSHARQLRTNVGVDDLVASIRSQGLIVPIHVVEIKENRLYELIDGQRRYLAFLVLRKADPEHFSSVPCMVYRNTMEPWEKKTFSLHANLSQIPISKTDRINAVTAVYENFGGIRDTVQATGLSESTIRRYVRMARLPRELQSAIRDEISENTALDVADLYDYDPSEPHDIDIQEMLGTAKEMQKLTGKFKKYVRETKRKYPDRQIPQIVAYVRSRKYTKYDINVAVESGTYERIDAYREREKIEAIPLAAVDLIHDGLETNEAQ